MWEFYIGKGILNILNVGKTKFSLLCHAFSHLCLKSTLKALIMPTPAKGLI